MARTYWLQTIFKQTILILHTHFQKEKEKTVQNLFYKVYVSISLRPKPEDMLRKKGNMGGKGGDREDGEEERKRGSYRLVAVFNTDLKKSKQCK